MIHCSVARGELEAAREVLAVSERELQRVKQKGCEIATLSDRRVYQVPNYKALPWPVVTGPDITLENDANNKDLGRASVNAAEFAEPFVGGTNAMDLRNAPHKPAYNTPGTDFAGSANLIATEQASFVNSELPEPPLYQQLASSIRMNWDGLTPPGDETAPAAMAQSELGTPLPRLEPPGELAQQLPAQALLYGAPSAVDHSSSPPSLSPKSFFFRLALAAKGAAYDLLHFEKIDKTHLYAAACSSRATYVLFRDGRGPYIAFLVLSAALVAFLLCRLCLRSAV